MRVDYETISIIISLTFNCFEQLKYFIQDNYSEIYTKLNFGQYYPFVISDTVRLLDRQSLIDDRFFNLLLDFHPLNCGPPGSENLHDFLKEVRLNWRKGNEPPRKRID